MRRAPDEISDDAKCKAWRITETANPKNKASAATQGAWLVQQPGVHPLWEYWMINVAHLRPIEGTPDPALHFDGATHEFVILSINPEACPMPDPDKPYELRFLSPPDLTKQVKDISDDDAKIMIDQMVSLVVNGRMALDSDYRGAWNTLLDNTVLHLKHGCHGSQDADSESP